MGPRFVHRQGTINQPPFRYALTRVRNVGRSLDDLDRRSDKQRVGENCVIFFSASSFHGRSVSVGCLGRIMVVTSSELSSDNLQENTWRSLLQI